MKRNTIIFMLLFICIICTYTFEMSDLSVADFTLIHEPTGKIFSFYDSPERFFEIIGEKKDLKENGESIENNQLNFWYKKTNDMFNYVYKNGTPSNIDILLDNFIFNKLYVESDFKTVRGIGIDSNLEEILNKYNNCYVGNLGKNNWGIWDDSVELSSEDSIKKNINTVFLICKLNNYGRVLNFLTNDGIYYVIEFKLDENKKVTSIGFFIEPYLK